MTTMPRADVAPADVMVQSDKDHGSPAKSTPSRRVYKPRPFTLCLAMAFAGLIALVLTLSGLQLRWLARHDDTTARPQRHDDDDGDIILARSRPKSLRVADPEEQQLIFPQPECEPRTIRIEDYPKATSKCSFYDGLQRLSSVAPPRFKGDHMLMCDERAVLDLWNYCLPITARKDLFCRNADRNDILNIPPRRQLCYASVLHLLTADVYDVFRSVGGKPVLLYGTLLGAVRNASIISYTEDTDIGFQMNGYHRDQVLNELRNRGYHVFPQGIWRVCVAPTHPLASKLYDPSRRLTEAYSVPYADLYAMAPMMTAMGAVLGWHVQEVRDDRPIPEPQFQPYSQVTLNGLEYDTLAAPIDFLVHEYGEDYLRPKRRGGFWWW